MSYTCPKCGRTSHHPMDEQYRYCGACHSFEDFGLEHYILDDEHRPVKTDFMTAAMWFEKDENRVLAHTATALHEISTIFLLLDHRHLGKGPPLLFETMVHDGNSYVEQIRYVSWDDAVAGHAAQVKRFEKIEADATMLLGNHRQARPSPKQVEQDDDDQHDADADR